MATFYPRNLDPFGDNTLHSSWIFTNSEDGTLTLNSEQNNNPFVLSTGNVNTGVNGYNSIENPNGLTTNPIPFSGEVDATFSCWMYVSNNANKISFGEVGQRYNVEFECWNELGSTKLGLFIHKHGETIQFTTGSGWKHLVAVYNALASETTFYVNGISQGSIPLVMKFNDSKLIELTSTTSAFFTDIQMYTVPLKSTDVVKLYNNNFNGLPSYRTHDPFNDNSLKHSWMFQESMGDSFLDPQMTLNRAPLAVNEEFLSEIGGTGFEKFDRTAYTFSQDDWNLFTINPIKNLPNWSFCITAKNYGSDVMYFHFSGDFSIIIYPNQVTVKDLDGNTVNGNYLNYDGEGFTIGISFDGSNFIVFIDGYEHGRTTVTNQSTSMYSYVRLDADISSSGGLIDEILVFNRALNETELELASHKFVQTSTPVTVNPSALQLTIEVLVRIEPFAGLDPFGDGSLVDSWSFNKGDRYNDVGDSLLFLSLGDGGVVDHPSLEQQKVLSINPDTSEPSFLTSNNITSNSNYSLSFIFRVSDIGQQPIGTDNFQFYSSGDFGLRLYINGAIDFGFGFEGLYPNISYTTPSIGEDFLVTLVFTSSSVSLYINSSLAHTTTDSNISTTTFSYSLNSSGGNMPILLDDICYFDKVLSTQDVATLFSKQNFGIIEVNIEVDSLLLDITNLFKHEAFIQQSILNSNALINNPEVKINNLINVDNLAVDLFLIPPKIIVDGVSCPPISTDIFSDGTQISLIDFNGDANDDIASNGSSYVTPSIVFNSSGGTSCNRPYASMTYTEYITKFETFTSPTECGTNFTVNFFVKFNSIQELEFFKFYNTLPHDIGLTSSGQLGSRNFSGFYVNGTTVLQQDTWYGITIVFKANNYLKVYLNGSFEFQTTQDVSGHSADGFYLGKNYFGTYGLQGSVAYFSAFNRDLTDVEIAQVGSPSGDAETITTDLVGILDYSLPINVNINEPSVQEILIIPEPIDLSVFLEISYTTVFVDASLQLSIIFDIEYGGYDNHNTLSISQYINQPEAGSYINSTIVGYFPLLRFAMYEPTIPVDYEQILQISFDCLGSVNNHYIIVTPEVVTLNISTILFNYVGHITSGVVADGGITIQTNSIPLRLSLYNLPTKENAYSQPQPLYLQINNYDFSLFENVFPNALDFKVEINSNVAQPTKDRRVSKIAGVELDTALYWSQNNYVNNIVLNTQLAIDGSNVYSAIPLKKFTSQYEISSKQGIMLKREKVDAIIASLTEDEIEINFNDGSFEKAKYVIENRPIRITPVFDGSEYYYIDIKVLI
jgi:hypothetical protein